ncbi:uncharacterized protein LOC144128679 isoform X5 [Amblyomma americanum]
MRAVLDAEVRVMKPEPETKVFAGLLILLTSLLCGKQAVIACSTAEVGIVGDDDFDIYEKLCYYSRHGNSCTCRPGYIINGTRCRDVEEPMATFCPDDIVVYHKTPTVNVSWEEPTFVDNGPGEVKVVADTEPGSAFIWGPPTTVTYRATDAAGNTAICSFKVVVRSGPLRDGGRHLRPSVNVQEAPPGKTVAEGLRRTGSCVLSRRHCYPPREPDIESDLEGTNVSEKRPRESEGRRRKGARLHLQLGSPNHRHLPGTGRRRQHGHMLV